MSDIRSFSQQDVGLVFTICKFPEFTYNAIGSLEEFYPGLSRVAIDDHCRAGPEHETELERIQNDYDIPILKQEVRRGTGRAIDRGLRFLQTPLILTIDHGIRIHKPGLLEQYVEAMSDPQVVGVGRRRGDKKCNHAFGPYIDPLFALWDCQFIVEEDLSFKLVNITIGDWSVEGCSTGQFLQYRAMRLGRRLSFISARVLHQYVGHERTPKTRGRNASPYEGVIIDEDYLIPRRRRPDGSLAFKGQAAWRERKAANQARRREARRLRNSG